MENFLAGIAVVLFLVALFTADLARDEWYGSREGTIFRKLFFSSIITSLVLAFVLWYFFTP